MNQRDNTCSTEGMAIKELINLKLLSELGIREKMRCGAVGGRREKGRKAEEDKGRPTEQLP